MHTAAQEHSLDARTRAADRPWSAMAARAAVAGAPQTVGQWGPLVDWPVVGMHVALLPNGKVPPTTRSAIRPRSPFRCRTSLGRRCGIRRLARQTPVDVDTGYNIFCSGLAHLTDGSVFVAGGNNDQLLNGIPQTHLFDPRTELVDLGPTWPPGAGIRPSPR